MNLQTVLVLAIVTLLVGLALRSMIRNKRNGGGCCGCPGGCCGCSGCEKGRQSPEEKES